MSWAVAADMSGLGSTSDHSLVTYWGERSSRGRLTAGGKD
jgi:hypothetical protein